VLTLQSAAATASARPRQKVATIQAEGTTWGGLTHRRRLTALRISVSGWKTTDDDVGRYPRHPPRRRMTAFGLAAILPSRHSKPPPAYPSSAGRSSRSEPPAIAPDGRWIARGAHSSGSCSSLSMVQVRGRG
jgi:hypothetical protein